MKLPRSLLCWIALSWVIGAAPAAAEEFVVIIHPGLNVTSLTRTEVINIFLGRYKKLPGGLPAVPLDTAEHKGSFYESLVHKTLPEINAYWARLTFSGQTSPPRQLRESQVFEQIAKTPGAIGYISKSRVDSRVRVVFDLKP